MSNSDDYYANDRAELLKLVPLFSKKILDVGCASGNFGKIIKQRQSCHITGIEINNDIAEQARKNLDFVFTGSIEKFINRLDNNYDCIILADILEHLINPENILFQLSKKLNKSGIFIISLPNFSNYYVFEKLIYGNFSYDDSGILDKTHLSFFAKANIIDLLNKLNLEIVEFLYAKNRANISNELISIFQSNNIDINLFLQESENFQYFITAKQANNIEINKIFDSRINIIERLAFSLANNFSLDSLITEIINQNNFDNSDVLYCLAYIYSKNKDYKSVIEILEKLVSNKLNKDLCYLFYYNLKNLSNYELADIFYNKIENLTVYSPIKDILVNFPLE